MFVSYELLDIKYGQTYGYMVFDDSLELNVKELHEYIEKRTHSKIKLHFITSYSSKKTHNVQFYTNGKFNNMIWNHPLDTPQAIDELYLYLYREYGYSNILGYS